MQSYSVIRDGFPPFSHTHTHPPPPPLADDPSPSSAATAPSPPHPHGASQRSRIPAFAHTSPPPASRPSTEPAAHALARPDSSRPLPPPFAPHALAAGGRANEATTSVMSAPLPTTNRHIPAFGPSSSSSSADTLASLPAPSYPPHPAAQHPPPPSSKDPSRHSPEADNECAAALSALAASAPSPSPAPSSQPLSLPPPPLSETRSPPLTAHSILSRTATASSVETGDAVQGPMMPSVLLSPDSGEGSGSAMGEGDDGTKGGKGKKELKQTKRAAQNRAAQRAFRERKQQQIRDLETRASTIPLLEQHIAALESRCQSYELERQAWDRERCALLGELETLRRVAGVHRASQSEIGKKRARDGFGEGDEGAKRVKVDDDYPRVEQLG